MSNWYYIDVSNRPYQRALGLPFVASSGVLLWPTSVGTKTGFLFWEPASRPAGSPLGPSRGAPSPTRSGCWWRVAKWWCGESGGGMRACTSAWRPTPSGSRKLGASLESKVTVWDARVCIKGNCVGCKSLHQR